mgnify:CR=1 FL=1
MCEYFTQKATSLFCFLLVRFCTSIFYFRLFKDVFCCVAINLLGYAAAEVSKNEVKLF